MHKRLTQIVQIQQVRVTSENGDRLPEIIGIRDICLGGGGGGGLTGFEIN